jgi:hypothetical protein
LPRWTLSSSSPVSVAVRYQVGGAAAGEALGGVGVAVGVLVDDGVAQLCLAAEEVSNLVSMHFAHGRDGAALRALGVARAAQLREELLSRRVDSESGFRRDGGARGGLRLDAMQQIADGVPEHLAVLAPRLRRGEGREVNRGRYRALARAGAGARSWSSAARQRGRPGANTDDARSCQAALRRGSAARRRELKDSRRTRRIVVAAAVATVKLVVGELAVAGRD